MDLNFSEILTLQKGDSVAKFKNKVTDTIDFLLKSYGISDNSSVKFNISINVSKIQENLETKNSNVLIKRESRNTNDNSNQEDLEYKNVFRIMNEALQWRLTLRKRAIATINEKIHQVRILKNAKAAKIIQKAESKRAKKQRKAENMKKKIELAFKNETKRTKKQKKAENMKKKIELAFKNRKRPWEPEETSDISTIKTRQKTREEKAKKVKIAETTKKTSQTNVKIKTQSEENDFTEPKILNILRFPKIKEEELKTENNVLTKPESSMATHNGLVDYKRELVESEINNTVYEESSPFTTRRL